MKSKYLIPSVITLLGFILVLVTGCGESKSANPLSSEVAAYTGTLIGSIDGLKGYTFKSTQYEDGSVKAAWTGPSSISGTLTGTAKGLQLSITGLSLAGCTVSSVSGSTTSTAIQAGTITGTLNALLAGGGCNSLPSAQVSLTKK